jgi:hypothetical protein
MSRYSKNNKLGWQILFGMKMRTAYPEIIMVLLPVRASFDVSTYDALCLGLETVRAERSQTSTHQGSGGAKGLPKAEFPDSSRMTLWTGSRPSGSYS